MRDEKKGSKVTAIYEAIQELISEGADLNTMRVSDIASRAGIGKGTAYEYFSTKEEMIVKAVVYLVSGMVNRILLQMESRKSFKDKFIFLLDEMEEKSKQRTCILRYMDMLNKLNLCQQMHTVLFYDEEAKEVGPIHIIRYLLDEGKKDGIIAGELSQTYLESMMYARMLGFVMYLDGEYGPKDCTIQEIKQKIYEGMCKEFGK